MGVHKSETTEYLLYSEIVRLDGKQMSEEAYDDAKTSFNPILFLSAPLLKALHQIRTSTHLAETELEATNKLLSELEEHEIKLEPNAKTKLSTAKGNFVSMKSLSENTASNIIDELLKLKEKSEQMTKEIKNNLYECLKKNLKELPESTVKPIFNADDANTIITFFESEQEFNAATKIKFKSPKISADDAYEILVTTIARKALSPMLSEKEKEEAFKKNIKLIKPCLDNCQKSVKSFIQANTTAMTNEQIQTITNMNNITEEVKNIVSNEQKRELENKKKSQNGADKAEIQKALSELAPPQTDTRISMPK